MLCKYTERVFPFKTYTILPASTIPTSISILDHCMFQLLEQIVTLIQHKYNLKSDSIYGCIQARFDNRNYQSASILFLNNLCTGNIFCVEQQNKWPIELLKQYNGLVTRKMHPLCNHRYYSVVTLSTADLVKIKECLERLPEPELMQDNVQYC